MGYNHGMAGAVSKMIASRSSVDGASTLATDDVTHGPDFISLDGSSITDHGATTSTAAAAAAAAAVGGDIEMENQRPVTPPAAASATDAITTTPESPYAV